MSWFKALFSRKKENSDLLETPRHTFSNEERNLSLDIRRQNRELNQLEQEYHILEKQRQIQELREEINKFKEDLEEDYSDDDNNIEDSFIKLLMPLLSGVINPTQNPNTQGAIPQAATPEATPIKKINLTDDQIKEIVGKNKKQLNKIKFLDDTTLKQLALNKFPDFDEDTINRAIVIVRSI